MSYAISSSVSIRCCLSMVLMLFSAMTVADVTGLETAGSKSLTLHDALTRVIKNNPELEVFELKQRQIDGLKQAAKQAPGFDLTIETDNVFGTGEVSGVKGAELTVALSSVIEMGDKQRLRVSFLDAKKQLTTTQKQVRALDLLAAASQNFINVLSLQAKLELAVDTVSLMSNNLQAVSKRAKQGATSQAEVLRAKAALTQAELALNEVRQRLNSQKMLLAAHWGAQKINFDSVKGELFSFAEVKPFDTLFAQVKGSPALEALANEYRMLDAQLKLVQSQSSADLNWQVGVKRLQGSADMALSAGISMPLFADKRNEGNIAAASAAKDQVLYHKKARLLSLRAQLFDAYQRRAQQLDSVKQIKLELIPTLTQALTLIQKAYEQGRYSYLEWTAAQQELLTAQLSLIDAATSVLRNQTLIEQLTAQPLPLKLTAESTNQVFRSVL